MNLKKSPLTIQNKNVQHTESSKDYPTIADLMKDQNVTNDHPNTVHRRRDLDSLG